MKYEMRVAANTLEELAENLENASSAIYLGSRNPLMTSDPLDLPDAPIATVASALAPLPLTTPGPAPGSVSTPLPAAAVVAMAAGFPKTAVAVAAADTSPPPEVVAPAVTLESAAAAMTSLVPPEVVAPAVATVPPVANLPAPSLAEAEAGRALDPSGLPWDERIHAAGQAKKADGSWRVQRNLARNKGPDYLTTITTELRALYPVSLAEAGAADLAPVVDDTIRSACGKAIELVSRLTGEVHGTLVAQPLIDLKLRHGLVNGLPDLVQAEHMHKSPAVLADLEALAVQVQLPADEG